jgi:pre-mRNA-processing factor 40
MSGLPPWGMPPQQPDAAAMRFGGFIPPPQQPPRAPPMFAPYGMVPVPGSNDSANLTAAPLQSHPLGFFPPPPTTPRPGPMVPAVLPPISLKTAPPQPPIDPVNDVTCWSEHFAEDKRPFWFNRVTGTSTYEKPACLKTALERSAPSCIWKQFTGPEGKAYYSDGVNST